MKKKLPVRKALSQLALIGAAAGAAIMVQGNTRAEAEPQPHPEEVQQFLVELEAREAALGEAKREKGHEKRLMRVVEDAAIRTPSEAAINRIESALAG
ncbi:MAG TPA: hypothetical protein VGD10_00325 [Allosphingosinicella sp.]|uniref:hypothetical protein n=1 Tax=Allosphingosinicella sp. TaxID=2823234 RepID=UPI002EDB9057